MCVYYFALCTLLHEHVISIKYSNVDIMDVHYMRVSAIKSLKIDSNALVLFLGKVGIFWIYISMK